MKTALTIGGSDPTGGAGIQADIRTFSAFGIYGFSIPTALTAQNTEGVTDMYDIPADFFKRQIDTLCRDIRPVALKTGMTGGKEIIRIIAEKIREYTLKNLVVDPVTVSSSGFPLARDGTSEAVRTYLFPVAKVITPNIHEAMFFTEVNIQDESDMKTAALKLKETGSDAVIITGGHLDNQATDLLFDGNEFLFFQRDRIEGEYHGTGCAFSSAVTAGLALGYDLREAAVRANEFVWKAIQSAVSLGKGMKILNLGA